MRSVAEGFVVLLKTTCDFNHSLEETMWRYCATHCVNTLCTPMHVGLYSIGCLREEDDPHLKRKYNHCDWVIVYTDCCSQENYFYICLCRSAWKKSKNQLSTSGRLNSLALHCRLSNIWVKSLVFHSLQFPLIFSCNGSNWSSSNNSRNTLENVVLIRLWWVFPLHRSILF